MDVLVNFHFLRPWFLLLIPALGFLCYWLSQQNRQKTGFEQWIDPQLLAHISTAEQKNRDGLRHVIPYLLLGIAWLVVVLALAGPTWKQLPQPLHQSEQAMVIALDLSPSMMAEDNKPSRIVRARLKIQDLLTQRKDGLSALIAYAGEAHVVTPLTDDNQTIINLLSTLEPGLLPIPGSNTEMAMSMAKQLVIDAGLTEASIVLVTDGVDPSAINTIKKTLDNNITLYIMGLGTEKGAPVPINSNGGDFLRDSNNNIITISRDESTLKALADSVNGQYLPLQASNADIQHILREVDHESRLRDEQAQELDRTVDQWDELGPLLILLFLPIFSLMFRRGWLLTGIFFISPMLIPEPAYALSWDDLWLNQQQRAQKAFKEERFEEAEKGFTQHQWQGSAAYKNKNYQAALDAFSQGDTATDHYNKGNALSQLGKYDDAINAYDEALKKDPNFADAKKNKDIIENLKNQQQQQQSQDPNNQNKNDQQNSDQQQNQDSSSQDNSSQNNQQDQQKNSQQEQNQKNDPSSDNKQSDEQQPNEQQSEQDKQNSDKNQKKDNAEQEQNPSDTAEDNQNQQTQSQAVQSELSDEEKQEIEQWIRKIPDDPSGLLRNKFQYEYDKRRQLYQNGQWELPDNNAHQRY